MKGEPRICECPGCERPAKWKLHWWRDTVPRESGIFYACGYHKHSKPGAFRRWREVKSA